MGKNDIQDYDVTGSKTARFETTIGRIIFNRQCLPADYEFINYKMVKGDIAKLVSDCCDRYPEAEVAPILDAIKYSGFHYATMSGLTISVWDALIPDDKWQVLDRAQSNVDQINEHYEDSSSTRWSAISRSLTSGPPPPTRSLPRCCPCSTRRTPST